MKSLLVALLAVGSLSLNATVVGSKHDLSSTGPGGKTNTTQVCVFCHTPHGAAATQIIPLWNKTTTSSGSFQMYNNTVSGTLQGTVDATPTGASMACFTCHDGTQAVGNMINLPNDIASVTYTAGGQLLGTGIVSGTALLGKDLTNDHPISITYQQNLDATLKDPTTFAAGTVRLFPSNINGSKVQCASCHDVHNYGVAGTTAPFLRVTMVGSALCTSCHLK
jgi:hypothetical protein